MITEIMLNWAIGQIAPTLSARLLGLHDADVGSGGHSRCLRYLRDIHARGAASALAALGAQDYDSAYRSGFGLPHAAALEEVLASFTQA